MANILVSGVRMDMGGTEIAQIAFMKKLLAEGHKVTLLLSQKRGPLIDRIPDGVRILTIPMKKSIFLDRMMGRVIDGRPFAFPVKCICKVFKILTILISIVTSLGTVLLPRASYYIEHGEIEEFRRIGRKALNFVFLIACPLMIYFILFARPGIYFLSNKAYEGAVAPMRIILPTLLFVGITNITGIQMLVPMGKEIVVLWSEIGGAVTDIILNALLIPKLASQGAAIGTVAAEMVVLIIQYAALRKEVAPAFKAIQYPKIIAGIVLASLASFWVIRLSLGNFVTLLISAVIFFAVYGGFLLAAGEPLTREIVITLYDDIKGRLKRSSGRLR